MNTTNWKIDTAHSEIAFKVKHMMISTVTGHFEEFNAGIESDNDDFKNAKLVSVPRLIRSTLRIKTEIHI